MNGNSAKYVWAALRIAMGWLFFWGFLDKLLGLGFATAPESAWIRGGSPTFGFLSFGTAGPLAPVFQVVAGNPIVDFLFMAGLALVGLALLMGIGVRIAGYGGALMVLMMWLAHLPPQNNPLIDQHIVYAILLIGFAVVRAGQWVGLGNRLARPFSRRAPTVAAILQ